MRLTLFFALMGWLTVAGATELTVSIEGAGQQGDLYVALFNGPEAFPGGTPWANRRIEVDGGSPTVSFEDMPTGRYALAVYQDLNGNGKLDRNFFGIPSEPVGVSGETGMGPPTFQEAAFRFESNPMRVVVTLD